MAFAPQWLDLVGQAHMESFLLLWLQWTCNSTSASTESHNQFPVYLLVVAVTTAGALVIELWLQYLRLYCCKFTAVYSNNFSFMILGRIWMVLQPNVHVLLKTRVSKATFPGLIPKAGPKPIKGCIASRAATIIISMLRYIAILVQAIHLSPNEHKNRYITWSNTKAHAEPRGKYNKICS